MKVLKIMFLLLCAMVTSFMHGKFDWISSDNEFLDRINAYKFALVGFVQSRIDGKYDKQLASEVKKLRKTMQAASQTTPYKDWLKKDVGFFMVDADKDFGKALADDYKVAKFPMFLLFEQGEILTESKDGNARLEGFVSKADMLTLIDDYFGKILDELVEQKKEIDRLEREERIARYNSYDRYYGWNPYGGWGPYYESWGPYMCYGYSCYRRYPRSYPRSYVNFGVSL